MAWFRRTAKVRTDGTSLLINDPDGWVSNQISPLYGDYNAGGRGSWWVGSDTWNPQHWHAQQLAGKNLIPAVSRATQVIIGPIVSTPWRLLGREGTDIGTLPQWVRDPMLAQGSPGPISAMFPAAKRLTGSSFWEAVATSALWWGQAPWIYCESADRTPLAGSLRLLNPFCVSEQEGRWSISGTEDAPEVLTDFDGRFSMGGGSTWRLVVTRGLPPHDGTTPSGVLVRHQQTLRLGAEIAAFSLKNFASGMPSGMLKVSLPHLDEASADALKQRWMDAHGGDRRSVAVLSSSVDYSPVSLSPVDADTEKLHSANLLDVAHAFGISSAWLDTGGDSLTYSTVAGRRSDLVDITLKPFAGNITEDISTCLPSGQRIEVNWSAFTAEALTNEQVLAALAAGALTVDEARERLAGLPPLKEDGNG